MEKIKFGLMSSAMALAVIPSIAFAQISQGEESEANQAEVGDIVVVAQRRGENLQSVPIAITALSSERLAAVGIQDSRDLVTMTPSLQMPTQAGYMLPRLRGVGSTAVGPGIDSPVATYVDGIYFGAAPSTLLTLGYIDRVEVLKGPQGTLFGRNSTGGLLHIITPDPKPGFGVKAEVGYANYQTPSAKAYIEGGSEALSVGLQAGYSFQGNGYGTNAFTKRDANLVNDNFASRLTILANPTERLKIRISGDYSYLSTSYPETRQLVTQPLAADPNAPRGPYDTNGNTPNIKVVRQGGVSGNATLDLGSVSLVSITGYRKSKFTQLFDADRTPADRQSINNTGLDSQFSQEVHLESNGSSALKWLVGANYFYGNGKIAPGTLFTPFPAPAGPRTAVSTNGTVITKSYAAFGQATYALTDDFNLTAGIRYTDESRTANAIQTRTVVATGAITTSAVLPLSRTKYRPVTWRVSADYQVASDVMIYAAVSRGFKSGGYNLTTPQIPAPFLPETLTAYEAGFKSKLFDRKLRLNASGFYYDYKNILVTYSPAPGIIATINGPKATVYGLDVDMEAALTEHFRLFAAATIMHARFNDFPTAVFAFPLATGANNITTGNAKGNILPYTSEVTGNIGGSYTYPAWGGELEATTNLYYSNGFYGEADNLRRQPSYVNLSASLGWTSSDGFGVRIWGRNLTDEAVLAQVTSNAGGTAVAYLAPRTYGITLSKSF